MSEMPMYKRSSNLKKELMSEINCECGGYRHGAHDEEDKKCINWDVMISRLVLLHGRRAWEIRQHLQSCDIENVH